GVPHIQGADFLDALYGLGYLHALDRRTQLAFARAVGSGRATELLADKPGLLESDRFLRRLGAARGIPQEVDALDERARRCLQVYCDGVNDGFRQTGRSFPMWAAGVADEPWEPASALLIGNLLNLLGLAHGQQRAEHIVLDLARTGAEPNRLRELYHPYLDVADFDLLRRVKEPNFLSDEFFAETAGLAKLSGSNAWAISPRRSRSGHALLASDPHIEINNHPTAWHEAVLHWDGHWMMGAALPGTPMFAVGRNERLAWGVTYSMADCCDYLIEDCRARDGVAEYRRGDAWLSFETRDESFQRKGGPRENLRAHSNPQGVLEADPLDDGDGLYLLSQWAGSAPGFGKSLATWTALAECGETEAAMELVRDCPEPPLCWMFADADGHIGRQVSGRFPKRNSNRLGVIPVPGWDESNHWDGWISVSELPSEFDPPEGFLCSANENLTSPDGPVLTTLPGADYRRRRIAQRLDALPSATTDDCRELQYDVFSMQAEDLLERLLPLLPDGEAKRRLDSWDRQYRVDSKDAALFARFYAFLVAEVFGQSPEQGG
ncbi:MAG: penicillin acylase family protein, partial [Planctomycetales bacterium]